jgi:signal transduction histidine kinase
MDTAAAIVQGSRRDDPRAGSAAVFAAAAAAVVLLSGVSAALGAVADVNEPARNALVRASIVAVPMAAGLYATRLPGRIRFGRLLYATGVLAFVTTLAESGDSDLYTIGRMAGWTLEGALACLILAYPSGRLATRVDRRLVLAMAGVIGLLTLPAALVTRDFPLPSPWTSCAAGDGCPPNALFALTHQPGFVHPGLHVLSATCLFAVMIAIVMRLEQRTRAAPPSARPALLPVLGVGIALATLIGVAVVSRELQDDAPTVAAVDWALTLATPAISLAFLAGLLHQRLWSARALRCLARDLPTLPDAAGVRRALADALGDPSAQLAFPVRGRPDCWVDEAGHDVAIPPAEAGRVVHLVGDDGAISALVVHDVDHPMEPQQCDAAARLATVALDNQRLTARARTADREVRRSRARIAASADAERRRIERDLHDGAQQRLVALRIELGLLEDLADRDPGRLPARLRELERNAEEALDELRALAHGVCPPLLTDRGIANALEAAAHRSTTPVAVGAHGVGRYPPEVETAVYFVALEALQNIDKHALRAAHASVDLDGRGGRELRFVVHDDGPGAEQAVIDAGAGVLNMRDRILAVGGRLEITSRPGRGTTVRGTVPVTPLRGRDDARGLAAL